MPMWKILIDVLCAYIQTISVPVSKNCKANTLNFFNHGSVQEKIAGMLQLQLGRINSAKSLVVCAKLVV